MKEHGFIKLAMEGNTSQDIKIDCGACLDIESGQGSTVRAKPKNADAAIDILGTKGVKKLLRTLKIQLKGDCKYQTGIVRPPVLAQKLKSILATNFSEREDIFATPQGDSWPAWLVEKVFALQFFSAAPSLTYCGPTSYGFAEALLCMSGALKVIGTARDQALSPWFLSIQWVDRMAESSVVLGSVFKFLGPSGTTVTTTTTHKQQRQPQQ